MRLRSRLLMQSCFITMMTGAGITLPAAFANAQAPVPLFLKQEAEQNANSQSAPSSPTTNNNFGQGDGTQPETFPSDPDAVQTVTLQAVDAEAVGTLGRERGGLGVDMWNGTSRETAARLLTDLPATPATHTARDLARRLLLSIAAIPDDHKEISMLETRAAKLINMGELDGAIDLVRATPQGARGSLLAQTEVNALMISGKLDDACAAIDGYGNSFDDLFWLKANIMCALHANDRASASFSTDLVREMEGETDKTFFGLVAAIRNGAAASSDILVNLRPIDIALLEIAKQNIPTSQLETGNPSAILGLVNASATSTDIRLEAARKAESLGLIDTKRLRNIYGAVSFDADTLINALDAAPEAVPARQYAKLYQAAGKSDVPAVRAEILAALYDNAIINGDFAQASRLTSDLLADIPVNGDFSWFAIDALKASVAADNMERAAGWLQTAKNNANPGNDIESRLILLYPVLALAGLEDTGASMMANADADASNGSVTVNLPDDTATTPVRYGLGGAVALTPPATTSAPMSDAQAKHRARMTEWQEMDAARGDQIQAKRDAELIFSLFDGFGIEVPVALWNVLLTAPYLDTRQTINTAVSHHLETAAMNMQRGKTVALAIQAQQVAGAPDGDPKDLSDAVAALNHIGLTQEARRLAVEILMARSQ
ncbi:antifreeze glycopeptide [Thalassospira lucentensis]|uniref:antifreeze glycopeptide n=1 Tax=Thalassospira lucentensis TaxID=168935 RepID=UPI0029433913|nr:antifreeze glycopeptide [Thalassospira lucentensis]WOI13001.1 antifreeze glycopeptide [Thalassospira lucentensis]